jgi:hypothetical protein
VQTLPKVELVRKLSQKTGTLQVTKNLVADSGELPTDLSYVFYVALFSDETYTVRVSDVKRFSFENGTSSIVEFANLTPGMKYYIAETDANGNRVLSGMLSDDYSFVADFPNGNNVEIPTTGDVVTLSFNNTVFELAGAAPSLSGQLTVTKRVRNSSGSAQKTDETFYIGIFTDNTYGTLASGLSSNPIAISMDGASQSEETVTVSFDGNGTTTYYLTEITDEGTPVSRDASFAYTAGYSDVKVSYSASQVDQSVTVTNTQNETETEPMTQVEPDTEPDTFVEPTTEPPTTETPQSETPQSESESESETNAEGKEVKTGDDTPIALYVGICLIAALILAEEFWRRRRNANR